MKFFTSSEIAQIIGTSIRQLQYWDDTGLVYPSIMKATGRGTRRLYSELDLLLLKVIKKLLDSGISIQCIRRSISFLQKLLKDSPQVAELVLVSDGHYVYAYKKNDNILGILHKGQQILRLGIGDIVKEAGTQIEHVQNMYNNGIPDKNINLTTTTP